MLHRKRNQKKNGYRVCFMQDGFNPKEAKGGGEVEGTYSLPAKVLFHERKGKKTCQIDGTHQFLMGPAPEAVEV